MRRSFRIPLAFAALLLSTPLAHAACPPVGSLDLGSTGSVVVQCIAGTSADVITNSGSTDATMVVDLTGTGSHAGTITDGSARVSLVKIGTGTLTLAGTGAYTGDAGFHTLTPKRSSLDHLTVSTVVTGGTLAVGNAAALGTNAIGIVDATLATTSGSITLANHIGVGGASPVSDPTRNDYGRATFDTTGGKLTLTGVLMGYFAPGADFPADGGIVKTGTGTLILAPVDSDGNATYNEFAGGIDIQQGTVQVGTLEAMGTRRNRFAMVPTATIHAGATLSFTGDVYGGDDLVIDLQCASAGYCAGSYISVAAGKTVSIDTEITSYAPGTTLTGGAGRLSKVGPGNLILSAANSFTGGLDILEGTLTVTNTLDALGSGAISMYDGTTLAFDGVSGTVAAPLLLVAENDPTIDVSTGNSISWNAVISGTGILGKTGAGTLILPSGITNTYTGDTNVSAGILQVDGSIATSPLTTVSSGSSNVFAALTGTGTVGALSVDWGTVKPGNTAAPTGTLTVAGTASFTGNSILAVSVDGTGASKLAVTGHASIAGSVTATLLTGATAPTAGTKYTILTASGGVSGTFSSLTTAGFGSLSAVLGYDADTVWLEFGSDRGAVSKSVGELVRDRQGQVVTERILASILLAANEQVSCTSACMSSFASFGSFQAGVHGRAALTDEWSLLGGLAMTAWDSGGARVQSSPMFALGLRWDPSGFGSSRPYAEISVASTPWSRVRYERHYDVSGVGYTGRGTTDTSSLSLAGRLGWVTRLGPTDEVAASVEMWTGWLRSGAYAEATAGNPIPASYGTAIDHSNIARFGGQWTHLWAGRLESQINLGVAQSFGSRSGLSADVTGLGAVDGTPRDTAWAEYGLRLGWRINKSLVADVFADGTLGPRPVGNTLHGGLGLRYAF